MRVSFLLIPEQPVYLDIPFDLWLGLKCEQAKLELHARIDEKWRQEKMLNEWLYYIDNFGIALIATPAPIKQVFPIIVV